jgi:hypothetical protein
LEKGKAMPTKVKIVRKDSEDEDEPEKPVAPAVPSWNNEQQKQME